MALITCVECGKEISCKAENCPNCGLILNDENRSLGYKLHEKEKYKPDIGLYSVIFGFILPIVGFILGVVGIVKGKKYSVYGVFISIFAVILYTLIIFQFIGYDWWNAYPVGY